MKIIPTCESVLLNKSCATWSQNLVGKARSPGKGHNESFGGKTVGSMFTIENQLVLRHQEAESLPGCIFWMAYLPKISGSSPTDWATDSCL